MKVAAVTYGAWLQVDAVLWVVGWIAWLVGLAHQWRLRRRFQQKIGKDMFGLDDIVGRYLERPWLWLIEAPRVVARAMAVGTTPIADPELESMRRTSRRWITAGGLCMVVAIGFFLVPVVWLMVSSP